MSGSVAPSAPGRSREAETVAHQLYAAHRARLLVIARNNCGDSGDAEEALHDAFILFIERFDPACGSPALPWLTLTLKRRCWAIYKRRRELGERLARVQREQVALRGGRSVEDLAEITEGAELLKGDIAALKPQERRALALLASGHSYREIATRLGWSVKRVDHCLERARAKLRERAQERLAQGQ